LKVNLLLKACRNFKKTLSGKNCAKITILWAVAYTPGIPAWLGSKINISHFIASLPSLLCIFAAENDRNMQPGFEKKYINVYLGLGSNMGDRLAHLRAAADMISKNIGKIARKSHIYETQPWGNTEQEAFLNQVIMVNTTLDPRDLLDKISRIERELGRERREKNREKWGPRPIDIDILFYGKRIVRDKGLEIPHPELHKRAFVLVPLLEIAPDLQHPVLKRQIDELYMDCTDESDVVMLG
jgi:2-amino-4-hydroxy-6-hydroxymethyldihydropteridine diphosphokinase